MKRFYKIAQAVATNDGQYAVCVDGKPIKTPSRNVLASPFKGIADVNCGGGRILKRSIPNGFS